MAVVLSQMCGTFGASRKLVSDNGPQITSGQVDWDKYIYKFMFPFIVFRHDATGLIPAELYLGRNVEGPEKWRDSEKNAKMGEGWTTYFGCWGTSILARAKDIIYRHNRRNTKRCNRKHRKVKLKVRDKVMLRPQS